MNVRSVDSQRYLPDLAKVSRGSARQPVELAQQAFVSELNLRTDERPALASASREDLVNPVDERAAGDRRSGHPQDDANDQPAPRQQALSLEELASLIHLPARPGSALDVQA